MKHLLGSPTLARLERDYLSACLEFNTDPTSAECQENERATAAAIGAFLKMNADDAAWYCICLRRAAEGR